MSRILSIRVPMTLYKQLERHARGRGLSVTEAARDLLRRGVGVSVNDSAREEGKLAAYRDWMKRLNGA